MIRYLNNDGNAWIQTNEKGKRENGRVQFIDDNGAQQTRAIDQFESCGNFAVAVFRYKGKRYTRGYGDERDGANAIVKL